MYMHVYTMYQLRMSVGCEPGLALRGSQSLCADHKSPTLCCETDPPPSDGEAPAIIYNKTRKLECNLPFWPFSKVNNECGQCVENKVQKHAKMKANVWI